MLLNISPLCLYHNVPMILTQETLHPRRSLKRLITGLLVLCAIAIGVMRWDTATTL